MTNRTIQLITYLLVATGTLYFAFLVWFVPWVREKTAYVAASVDKEARLAQLPGKRLVLVGGSGLAMGMNSAHLQTITSWPVVNMGLHASLGLPFMLHEALAGIRAGDVVVLCPEYELNEGDPRLLSQLIDVNPQSRNLLSLTLNNHIRLRVQNVQRCLQAGFNKVMGLTKIDPVYNRLVFNKHGDSQGHYSLKPKDQLADLVQIKKINLDENVELLNWFIDCAKAKGVHVVMTYPAYCQKGYRLNSTVLNNLHQYYRQKLICSVVGQPSDFVMSDSLFFDTVYHLTKEGAHARTVQLIKRLSPVLASTN